MASRDVVTYKTPLSRLRDVAIFIFLAFYLVWTILPIFLMFVSSFKDLLAAFQLPPVGAFSKAGLFFDFTPTTKHYYNLFYNLGFSTYLLNSIIAAGGSALVSVVLGSMAAYSLSRVDFRGKGDLFFWIISTRMAPVVAVLVPLYAIFRGFDLVGTRAGLILAYTTFNLPFAIWILKGFFDNVPFAIEEASMAMDQPAFRRSVRFFRWLRRGLVRFWSSVFCSLGMISSSHPSLVRGAQKRFRQQRESSYSRKIFSGEVLWRRAS